MNKKVAHVIWAWGSTFAFAGLMYWLATLPLASSTLNDEVIKVVFRMLLYAVLFTLFYRSVIATLRNTVTRLSAWRSRQEAVEDAEFVLIIETLVVLVSILTTVLFAVFEENVQTYTAYRNRIPGEAERDVLVSTMSVLLTALVVYSMPAIGELEVAIKHKLDQGFGKTNGTSTKKSKSKKTATTKAKKKPSTKKKN